MTKHTFVACIAAVYLTTSATPARSQITIDVTSVTCDRWLAYKVADLDRIAIRLSGYVNGKRRDAVVELMASKDIVGRLVEACLKSRKTQ